MYMMINQYLDHIESGYPPDSLYHEFLIIGGERKHV